MSVFIWAMYQFENILMVLEIEKTLHKTLWCTFFGTPSIDLRVYQLCDG